MIQPNTCREQCLESQEVSHCFAVLQTQRVFSQCSDELPRKILISWKVARLDLKIDKSMTKQKVHIQMQSQQHFLKSMKYMVFNEFCDPGNCESSSVV